ncbi:Panacea domain-containing protein [Candidatus Phytoplasma pruni]|uniref:DUF4065 domain-containing protein n=1 Tax=Candidatus Phytoplasma pruni TaxID=479893 RepID=A0A851HKW3_9MOLU|nr:type II toxin-antitoxin system antitoxin SocA domain-containing protein [Candidatus Phytoplasma pruni]NWN46059.1 DUF4065 domain-containing protein [Candidatus Phytoplasma pruni]
MFEPKKISNIFIADAANYLIKRVEVNHMKLQKLLYYAYCKHLVKYKEKFIVGKAQAWPKGPVFKPLYQHLKHYGRDEIIVKTIEQGNEKKLSPSRKATLDFIINKYGFVDAGSLMRQTMREEPWQDYYEEAEYGHFPKSRSIPDESLYEYFKKEENWYHFHKICPTCLKEMD